MGAMYCGSLRSCYFPILLFRIPFLISTLTLTADTLWGWEFDMCSNCATHRMMLWVGFICFRNLSPATQEVGVTLGQRSFWNIYMELSWEFATKSTSFSFAIFFGAVRNNHQISIYSLVWQKYSKLSNRKSLRMLFFVNIQFGVYNSIILPFSIATSYHRQAEFSLPLKTMSIVHLHLMRLKKNSRKFRTNLKNVS
jgi:hypothetical protein